MSETKEVKLEIPKSTKFWAFVNITEDELKNNTGRRGLDGLVRAKITNADLLLRDMMLEQGFDIPLDHSYGPEPRT